VQLRLLPLLSSATEIIHALGLGEFQVGRSHECDYPPQVLSLPICTRPNIPVDGSSAEIDRWVKERAASAVSIYDVDASLIRTLRPTHIFTQTQCKVCAVSLEDVERAIGANIGHPVRIVALEPYALADVWRDIERVAISCGYPERGEALTRSLQQRIEAITERITYSYLRPAVAALEWLDPLMTVGNWMPELITRAGGRNLFGEPGIHSPWMSWEDLLAADPDVIVALPCGFNLERGVKEIRLLANRPHFADLKAVRTGNLYACDGNQFFNRPGPRLAESLEILAEILHPEIFAPRFEKIGWIRVLL
jgi:iron complex transport system substrate-binding protein